MPEDDPLFSLRTQLQTISADLRALSSDMQAVRSELLLEMEATKIELPLSVHAGLQPVKDSLREVQNELRNLRLCVESDVRPQMKFLTESHISPASKYERTDPEISELRREIRLIKETLAEFSEKLARFT